MPSYELIERCGMYKYCNYEDKGVHVNNVRSLLRQNNNLSKKRQKLLISSNLYEQEHIGLYFKVNYIYRLRGLISGRTSGPLVTKDKLRIYPKHGSQLLKNMQTVYKSHRWEIVLNISQRVAETWTERHQI